MSSLTFDRSVLQPYQAGQFLQIDSGSLRQRETQNLDPNQDVKIFCRAIKQPKWKEMIDAATSENLNFLFAEPRLLNLIDTDKAKITFALTKLAEGTIPIPIQKQILLQFDKDSFLESSILDKLDQELLALWKAIPEPTDRSEEAKAARLKFKAFGAT